LSDTEIHVAVLPLPSPNMCADGLTAFAGRLGEDVRPALEEATGIRWVFHVQEASRLPTEVPHRPSDFLDAASLRMVEGPFDAVVVVTDVALVSRAQRVVPGLVSSVGRVLVLSTRELRVAPRGEPSPTLESGPVRWNAATLLLHLLGHALGLDHRGEPAGSVMSPFSIDPARQGLPAFSERSRGRLGRLATEFPEREDRDEGTLSELAFHLSSAARHPRKVLTPVWRSRAPLLPLYLPRLSTAAVAPAFILVFTAEIWDAGFHMTDGGVWLFALVSVLASTIYLSVAQNLFLPHKEKRFHTEHLAVVNVAILLIVLFAILGLFLMLILLMLVIQIFIFPPDLVREWPSLELGTAVITLSDQIRIAALISTIGVLTGTLAGGLESRELLRHLALFRRDP
jgi:hypothetical protein